MRKYFKIYTLAETLIEKQEADKLYINDAQIANLCIHDFDDGEITIAVSLKEKPTEISLDNAKGLWLNECHLFDNKVIWIDNGLTSEEKLAQEISEVIDGIISPKLSCEIICTKD